MDIPTFLANYGGPGGVVAVLAWLFLSDRKQGAERRDELRKDIDREQADNDRLRGELATANTKIAQLEAELRRCQRGED
ncbi:hypothetical protein KTJ89_11225 [Brevibacterium sediminis]|uniref:hypothetical protein n=1 Tax=Brevibacterium sediminis TaxID=1857024 RepID=UPI002174DD1D|nr:hypothetical protein [Brevibacterium sediminis]MCS4593552.1 hypothetical protein [Brevibacterium sediminis]